MGFTLPQIVIGSNWLTLLYLFSWTQIRETIPGILGLFILCVFSGISNQDLKIHMHRFMYYAVICYYVYSIHIYSGRLETSIMGKLTNLFDTTVLTASLREFSEIFRTGEKKVGLNIPVISVFMRKINDVIMSMIGKK